MRDKVDGRNFAYSLISIRMNNNLLYHKKDSFFLIYTILYLTLIFKKYTEIKLPYKRPCKFRK